MGKKHVFADVLEKETQRRLWWLAEEPWQGPSGAVYFDGISRKTEQGGEEILVCNRDGTQTRWLARDAVHTVRLFHEPHTVSELREKEAARRQG